jgi:glutathione S-transferase
MSASLKSCPFCGDSAMVRRFGLTAEVLCTNCNARSPEFHATNADKAIAAWNARVDNAELAALAGIHAMLAGYDGQPNLMGDIFKIADAALAEQVSA